MGAWMHFIQAPMCKVEGRGQVSFGTKGVWNSEGYEPERTEQEGERLTAGAQLILLAA